VQLTQYNYNAKWGRGERGLTVVWASSAEVPCLLSVLLLFKDFFHIPLSEHKHSRRSLELVYAGAALRNNWSLADVGISFCSTLKCFLKV
jgi:hypothetical protein